MNKKQKLHDITKSFIKNQYIDSFCIFDPIAVDFVPEYVAADLYVDEYEGGATYLTLGVCSQALCGDYVWGELMVMVSKRLDYISENVMIDEVARIICNMFSEENAMLEPGMTFEASEKVKETFGFDYLMVDTIMEFDHLVGTLQMFVLVPLYQNENAFLKKHGYKKILQEYGRQVAEEEILNFDITRKPMDL